ncbi:hypothetical protein SVIO_099490 [Streptomyces violaceusniger]|uniref:Enoyl reductase (ER) domain-containing protein n=1 Tax=Streptomyces violaceusniger TaxID=68280 RepID=A0A4D4LJ47_STRVO|nr:hypothetical protein SVIO_099490 [Streptomyces violaceusniger]
MGLARALKTADGSVEEHTDLAALAAHVGSGAPMPDPVFVTVSSGPGEDVVPAARAVAHRTLDVVRAWLAEDAFAGARLVLVTRGALATEDGADPRDLAAAPAWGLVRSAQAEHPDRFVLLDVDGAEASLAVVHQAVSIGEPQLAVRGAEVLVPRLAPGAAKGVLTPPDGGEAWRLESSGAGTLEGLRLAAAPDVTGELGEHEVRVAVRAAGMNFRDVLISLNMYPDPGAMMGSEGAGVVVATGSGVTSLAVGDRVMGSWTGGFGPLAVADHRSLVRIPDGWSYTQAAPIPVVFGTALYGLRELGACGAVSRCWCIPPPVVWGWPRCSWRGRGAWRCSRPRARPSGMSCAASGWTMRISRRRGRWSSRSGSGPPRVVVVWTWSWTPWPVSSWTPRCGC